MLDPGQRERGFRKSRVKETHRNADGDLRDPVGEEVRNPREAGTGCSSFGRLRHATGFAARQHSEVQVRSGLRPTGTPSTREEETGSRLHGGERESLRGENARRARVWASGPAPASQRERTFEAAHAGRARRETARKEGVRRRAPDLREARSPEGGSSRALPG
jgi:hypothetical protein